MNRTVTIGGHAFTRGELWFISATLLFVVNWCGALIALACVPTH